METQIHTEHIALELSAVIVSVNKFSMPEVLVIPDPKHIPKLPSGPFDPIHHKTLELGLRDWIIKQTPFTPGYIEQLYTFGNEGRVTINNQNANRVISVGYLALTWQENIDSFSTPASWNDWYSFFPWEDWRDSTPNIIQNTILPALKKWATKAGSTVEKQHRLNRIAVCFAQDGIGWDYERVLERYELLYEAHMIGEVYTDKNIKAPESEHIISGRMMQHDHRRILATAIGRLRGKIKYRPVIFELMPDSFTLLQLQRTIEAIGGYKLHKQNFRRLLETNKIVEETGKMSTKTGGRPAALFQFRKDVLLERVAIGVKISPTA